MDLHKFQWSELELKKILGGEEQGSDKRIEMMFFWKCKNIEI